MLKGISRRPCRRGANFLGLLGGLFVQAAPASGSHQAAFAPTGPLTILGGRGVEGGLRGACTARKATRGVWGAGPPKMVLADSAADSAQTWRSAKGVKEPLARGQTGLSVFQSLDELGGLLGGTGKAKMVWESVRKGEDPFGNAEGVSGKARAVLAESFAPIPGVAEETVSRDGTTKLLIDLEDGLQVEAVVIPQRGKPTAQGDPEPRTTLCVSSQVGCNRACDFCATGKMGFIRQLSAHEILSQAFHGLRVIRERGLPQLNNVVFMGMGEPLNNPLNVMQATHVLTDQNCFQLARQRVTVSTVGPSPAAIRAAGEMPAMIAWSVHAADDKLRRRLVPTTAHKMTELRDAFKDVLTDPTRSRNKKSFMVAVTLIAGVNDGLEQADELVELLQPLIDAGIKIMVDLIPYNSIGEGGFARAEKGSVDLFQRRVREGGLACFVRVTRGDDENAACGQLATKAKRVGSKIIVG